MAAEKVLFGNDVSASWTINNANFSGTVNLYLVDAKGKRKLDAIISSTSKITFKLVADNQVLGKLRLELKWLTSASNRRIVANNVLEFVDNPENVTLQTGIITSIALTTTGVKTNVIAS